MKITRLDLDGAGSPAALVTRILEIERDMPIPVPIELLCDRLDIVSVGDLETAGYEAALITDECKANGAILVAKGRSRQKRRYSVSHELGHFLIPTHMPSADGRILCSAQDMRTVLGRAELDRRARMEAQANQFAALLLMPPPVLKAELRSKVLDLGRIIQLAVDFDVSKEAMARACVDHSQGSIAVIVVRDGKILRMYRRDGKFPFIAPARGDRVPADSSFHDCGLPAGSVTTMEECEPETWLGYRDAKRVELLEEQVLFQREGFAMIMLRAQMRDED